MALYYAQQFATTKLSVSGGIDASETTGIVLQSVTGIDTAVPGVLCLTWSDPLDTDTYEYISYTSIDGSNELQGVTRGVEGSTGRAHENLSDVAWVLTESHINKLNDMYETAGEGYKQIATPSNPSSGRNKLYFKTDNKPYQLTSAGTEREVGSATSKSVIIPVVNETAFLSTGDGKANFTVPEELNGMNLIGVHARVDTAGTTGTTDIQVRNVTDSVDMLSTKLTIDSGETGSDTATPAVIDATKDDVVTNDYLKIDIDAVSTTAPKGLTVRLRFALP